MKRAQPTDLISTSEARELLGVSRPTMTRLIKEGQIRHFPNLIDKRVKLVSRAEVLAIKPPRLVGIGAHHPRKHQGLDRQNDGGD